jgi:hypothetical protein
VEDDLRAIEWRAGKFICVAVGPDVDAAAWRHVIGAP